MTILPLLLLLMSVALTLIVSPAEAAPVTPPDPARIQAIAALLPEKPAAPGPALTDRAAWGRLAAQPEGKRLIAQAERLLTQPIPDQPDDLYLEYSRTGNRTHWQAVSGVRRGRLVTLALAECLENKGRFLPGLNAIIDALCAEKTWVLPAHDGALKNFHGTITEIDLGASALAWDMAICDALLGEKLDPVTRGRLRENVRRRVLTPFHEQITGKIPANWWLTGTNNWNAVCLAGVLGTALAEAPTRAERAEFAAAVEKYVHFFLSGFTPDGYCSEGLGYWDYGFGRFTLLSETLRRATGGTEDLLALPEAHAPALFATRIQIINGVAPAFADCPVDAQPQAPLMALLNAKFALGLTEYGDWGRTPTFGSLAETLIYNFPDGGASRRPAPATDALGGPRLRDWFDRAGILISRPAPNSPCRLGVALKGGNNAENHNHDDVGSYVVVADDRAVLLDPGGETYTARTFGPHRYDSKLLNSFGHAVPLVAGKLQREGADARGKILRTDFTPVSDTLEFDIASAYAVPALSSLTRTFVYSRQGAGALAVTDQVKFTTPQTFGTALITRGSWKQQPDGALLITDDDQALRVVVDTGGAAFTLNAEQINEDAPVHPMRLGINLTQPTTAATITLRISPAEAAPGQVLLPNGGFEEGAQGWNLPSGGMGAIATDEAAGGKASLKITDHDRSAGSDVSSATMRAAPDADYVLRGKMRQVSGDGLGLYLRFFDPRHRSLNAADGNGNTAPVGTVKGGAGAWLPFALRFHTPPGTTRMQLWIHSFSSAETEAYLDDLEIAPAKSTP